MQKKMGIFNEKNLIFSSKNKIKITLNFFLHISSSYAQILGETNFHTREIPRSWSEAERREKKRKLNNSNNNGQAMHGARKHAWPTQAAWANI